jgi:hypothetical protein
MEQFDEVFQNATRSILAGYFRLPIYGGVPVYRERAYCYELYHQMRKIWPETTTYWLNGEVSKNGHPDFGPNGPMPDFLVHRPDSRDNYLVMEVKPAERLNADNVGIDFAKLRLFRDYGYTRAVHLVFGAPASVTYEILRRTKVNFAGIELWGHSRVADAAEQFVVE